MTAFALILTFLAAAGAASWLAGLATRGAVSACNQQCNQGRGCNCMETLP